MKKILLIVILFIISLTLTAQYSREQAINIAIEIVGPDSLVDHPLFSRYEKINAGDTLWLESYFDYMFCPFESAWLFFVNDLPIAYWAHPCRYIFVDITSGNVEIKTHDWPPHPTITDWDGFLEDWQWVFNLVEIEENIPGNDYGEIKLFPNPSNNIINFKNPDIGEEFQIFICSASGTLIRKMNLTNKKNEYYSLDISNLPVGYYFLYIKGKGVFQKTEIFQKIN